MTMPEAIQAVTGISPFWQFAMFWFGVIGPLFFWLMRKRIW